MPVLIKLYARYSFPSFEIIRRDVLPLACQFKQSPQSYFRRPHFTIYLSGTGNFFNLASPVTENSFRYSFRLCNYGNNYVATA